MDVKSTKIKRLSYMLLAMALLTLGLTGCNGQKDDVALQAVNTLESRDGQQVFDLATPAAQEKYGKDGIIKRTAETYAQLGTNQLNYKQVKLDKKASDDKKRVYHAKMELASSYGTVSKDQTFTMLKDAASDSWRLDWTPSVILPGLTDDNTLKVQSTSAIRGKILDRDGNVLAETNAEGKRVYPHGAMTSHLVGYVRAVTAEELAAGQFAGIPVGTPVGRSGLELAYQDRLLAKNGVTITLSDRPDEVLLQSNPTNGEDIRTTIDMKVQKAAYDTVNGEWGAVAAVHPTTGQVLALASFPGFNPDKWSDDALSVGQYKRSVEEGWAPDAGNFALRYTPGSTQKLFTTLIGLREGVITPESGFEIYGSRWQPDGTWGGYTVHRMVPINGWINLHDALVYSDNIYFARVGLGIGAEKFVKGMEALGIGSDVPTPLAVQKSRATETGALSSDIQLADSAYGQYRVELTPLQMSLIYAALQNDGDIMKPRLLLEEKPEIWIADIGTPEHLTAIKKAFRDVVTVSHANADRNYAAFAGKTGTAEVGPGGKTNLGWFCGYDDNNPTCVMTVMINNVQGRGFSDVNTAAFGNIMDKVYADGTYAPSGLTPPTAETEQKAA